MDENPIKRKWKPPKPRQGMGRDGALNVSMDKIEAHCKKVTKTEGQQMKCIELNIFSQDYYLDCYETFHNK